MKKLLMFSVMALMAGTSLAMAQGFGAQDGQGGQGGPGGHRGPDPEKRLEKMFDRHDLNKDGVITEDEFLKEAKERFAKMDADSDGKVTKEEIKEGFKKMKENFKGPEGQEGGDNPPPPPPEDE